MKNRRDPRLPKVDKLLISYNIANSWLFLFNSFDFIFSLRDSENQQHLAWYFYEITITQMDTWADWY